MVQILKRSCCNYKKLKKKTWKEPLVLKSPPDGGSDGFVNNAASGKKPGEQTLLESNKSIT